MRGDKAVEPCARVGRRGNQLDGVKRHAAIVAA
jgi:hypothetical protein